MDLACAEYFHVKSAQSVLFIVKGTYRYKNGALILVFILLSKMVSSVTGKDSHLTYGFFCRYFDDDDDDDEMDPEIEEAYEKFCLESERKRKQWNATRE